MLINALCDYYDELAKEGKVIPEGCSKQAIHYLIALSPEGKIENIIDYQIRTPITAKNGKIKERSDPRMIMFPQRTQKPGIDANIVEHRPLYIFGLNYDKDTFTPDDKTDKARKSHAAFVEKNLAFIEELNSPVINAYRNFIQTWNPEKEIHNPLLEKLGKAYKSAYFAFCLDGHMEMMLQEDKQIKEKFQQYFSENTAEDEYYAQCAVTGERLPIARIHDKIRGVAGGMASGTVLVGYKTAMGCSYCHEQSYNSNLSTTVMKKYTFALNALLADKHHKTLLDDITVIYWATGGSKNERCADLFSAFFNGDSNTEEQSTMDKTQTDKMLEDTLKLAQEGSLTAERISSLADVEETVYFYITGIKPNASRLSLKFIYRRRFADILFGIAQHQADMLITGLNKAVPLWRLKKELISPKSSNQNIDPSLLSAIFRSILYNIPYPTYLLSTLVTRVKTDKSINSVRAGTIKSCINRQARANHQKEELSVALDINNTNQAYLCGRLFAVLEKIQQNSVAGNLNRTIKDAYFASAASKPALVFPKLLSLSQNHMRKFDEKNTVFYNKLIEEIIGKLDGEFPDTLMLTEQGKFMIGYYHQEQNFYVKKKEEEKTL